MSAGRPLGGLNIRFYRVLRLPRFADFWERRKDAHVAAVRVTCALVLAVGLLEMIFRSTCAGQKKGTRRCPDTVCRRRLSVCAGQMVRVKNQNFAQPLGQEAPARGGIAVVAVELVVFHSRDSASDRRVVEDAVLLEDVELR